MLQLYPGNLIAMKPSHYGKFKDLRKEINHLDSCIPYRGVLQFGVGDDVLWLNVVINFNKYRK
ncbi:hypothetical protein YC2023_089903 [Brassica napus]